MLMNTFAEFIWKSFAFDEPFLMALNYGDIFAREIRCYFAGEFNPNSSTTDNDYLLGCFYL